MMQKRICLALLLAALMLGLCGCAANPLASVEATAVPGLQMQLHSASASQLNANELRATLYFRFLDQPMLASESRVLTIKRDESAELAVVQALLGGPGAGYTELTRLFPEETRVESVRAENGILFVTLNEAFLSDDVPENWTALPEWQQEAPIRRLLTVQSLVCTLTETFPYASVQVMVRQQDGAKTTMRLDNAYFLGDATGINDPQRRDERCILTPSNAAQAILAALISRDYQTVYSFLAAPNGSDAVPIYDDLLAALEGINALSEASVSGGSVSEDGQRAILNAELTFLLSGTRRSVSAYPLRLSRVRGVWKLGYDDLLALCKQ